MKATRRIVIMSIIGTMLRWRISSPSGTRPTALRMSRRASRGVNDITRTPRQAPKARWPSGRRGMGSPEGDAARKAGQDDERRESSPSLEPRGEEDVVEQGHPLRVVGDAGGVVEDRKGV